MSYEDDEYGHPQETGEFARPDLLNGHLVLVFPVGYRDDLQTKFGVKDAVVCDIIDLDDKDDSGQPGKLYRLSNFMQGKLIQQLRPFIGRKVLGRMGVGVNKGGLNPPWIITDLSADPVALEKAKQWKVANPSFSPSQFIPREEWEQRQQAQLSQQPAQPAQRPAQPAQQPARPPQQQPSGAVMGSAQLSTEELDMLQQLRMEKARREAAENPFQDEPPF
jgi:hypothetical protein